MLAWELPTYSCITKSGALKAVIILMRGLANQQEPRKNHKNICTIPQNSNNPKSTAECEIEGTNQRILKPAY